MFLRLALLFLCTSSLLACSSSGGRAPVTDITLENNGIIGTKVAYNGVRQKTYTVERGDTLYGIAWRSGLDVNALIQYNDLNVPYLIHKGQVLQLTSDKYRLKKKENSKGDLASQNENKKGKSDCVAQNCNKNNRVELDREKAVAYSKREEGKKENATKNKNKEKTNKNNKIKTTNNQSKVVVSQNKVINNQKVSDWSWPVKGKVTKRFSASQAGMQGISIVSKRGTPILASAPGKVVYAGSGLRGYGNLIIIKHNYDYLSAYAHNEKLLISENEQIKKGQKIAIMGDSGSDHVNLHFEIRYRGKSVDPLRYLPKR